MQVKSGNNFTLRSLYHIPAHRLPSSVTAQRPQAQQRDYGKMSISKRQLSLRSRHKQQPQVMLTISARWLT